MKRRYIPFYKRSYYVLYLLLAVTLVVVAVFVAGGDVTEGQALPQIDFEMWQPTYTDVLLYWMYGILGLSVLTAFVVLLVHWRRLFQEGVGYAVRAFVSLLSVVVLLGVTYGVGSDEALTISGYDGSGNIPFYCRLSDMFLYAIYVLLVAALLAVVFNQVKRFIDHKEEKGTHVD